MQVAHPRAPGRCLHFECRASSCPCPGVETRGARLAPCPTTLCVWRRLPFTLGVCASEPRGALSSVPLAGRVRAARVPSRVGGGDAGRLASLEAGHACLCLSHMPSQPALERGVFSGALTALHTPADARGGGRRGGREGSRVGWEE